MAGPVVDDARMAVSKKITKRDVTGEKVLSAASDLFSERGFLATSVRDLATVLKMKSGSLYYHYPSKEALLAAVLERGIKAITAEVKRAVEACGQEAPTRVKFKAAMIANMRRVHSVGDVAYTRARTLTHLPEPKRVEQQRLRAQFAGVWLSLVQEGKQRGEISSNVNDVFLVMMVLGFNAFVGEWFDSRRRSIEDLAEHYTNILFDGLKGKLAAAPASKSSRGNARSAATKRGAKPNKVKSLGKRS